MGPGGGLRPRSAPGRQDRNAPMQNRTRINYLVRSRRFDSELRRQVYRTCLRHSRWGRDAEPAATTDDRWPVVRHRLWRPLCTCAFRAAEATRNLRFYPPRQVLHGPLRAIMASASAHAARSSDERLLRLYLDMLATERGAGANT